MYGAPLEKICGEGLSDQITEPSENPKAKKLFVFCENLSPMRPDEKRMVVNNPCGSDYSFPAFFSIAPLGIQA